MVIASLLILAQLLTPTAAPSPTPVAGGYGPWRFGMTKEQVAGVTEFGPYTPVSASGGLETKNGNFEGQKTNISFVFGDRGLRFIQIWAYEKRDLEEAIASFYRVYQHLQSIRGAVGMPGQILPRAANEKVFTEIVHKAVAAIPPGRTGKLQLLPFERGLDGDVFSSFFRQPQLGVYYVFLYYREPRSPDSPPDRALSPVAKQPDGSSQKF